MAKPVMLIRGPVGTRSGYGDMARDICRHLINLDRWDVKIWSCPWGSTPMNALTHDHPKDKPIVDRIILENNLQKQPEIFITITVPNEFQPLGKYNIGITAGIETTACDPKWIEAMNTMDVTFTISEHSKKVLSGTVYEKKDDKGNSLGSVRNEKPVEVLHNCVDPDVFRKIPREELDETVENAMSNVKEKFCFLFVGHWLSGAIGADRKDVGMLIKVFLEVFRKVPKKDRPALILKASTAGFSVLEREELLGKIDAVKASINATSLPNIYLLHGHLTESEMNSLNNHPKVKAFVTFTKGEGFGRPLLEASITGKPVIASGWSGHLDFLSADEAILLPGQLELVHESAVWEGVINKDTRWFQVDYQQAGNYLHHVWKNYSQFTNRGKKMAERNSTEFSFAQIQQDIDELMVKYLPEFDIPDQVELKLPDLPRLEKITLKKPKKVETEKHGLDTLETDGAVVQSTKSTKREATLPEGGITSEGTEIDGS